MDPIVRRALRRGGLVTLAATLLVATLVAALPTAAVDGPVPAAPAALGQAPGLRVELAPKAPAPKAPAPKAPAPEAPGPEAPGPDRVHATAAVAHPVAAVRIGTSGGDAGGGRHAGRNHVWSADLGLNRPVAWYSCSRSQYPGMAVYRWGCGGRNNVYLFAHAGGPFRRLHDVYVRGHLKRGMTVTYADGNGIVHRYRVAWWRVVRPTAGAFAYAAQSRPSMTLQTCVGAGDRYRLIVRLYRAD
jgi:Sortase domain